MHLHPGFVCLQGDAPQAGATSVLGDPLHEWCLSWSWVCCLGKLPQQPVDAQILSQVDLIPGVLLSLYSMQIERLDGYFQVTNMREDAFHFCFLVWPHDDTSKGAPPSLPGQVNALHGAAGVPDLVSLALGLP